jgi:enoyl-CoA hydratase/carnithine racemase
MSDDETIILEQRNGVLYLTINRPDVLNALDPASHLKLHQAFNEFSDNDSLKLAVLRGSGNKAFCVGSDLKVRSEMGGDDMPPTGFGGLAERFDLKKPIIAAVNGHAIGGGLEMVLACDMAIAVSTAKIGLPEAKIGLAAAGGLHRLARQLPMKAAMEVALTGQLFSAEKALALGLINSVVAREEFDTVVEGLVDKLLACAPLSHQATKEMMQKGLEASSLEAAFATSYPAYEAMLESEDAKEGSLAFLEKRTPVWKGK